MKKKSVTLNNSGNELFKSNSNGAKLSFTVSDAAESAEVEILWSPKTSIDPGYVGEDSKPFSFSGAEELTGTGCNVTDGTVSKPYSQVFTITKPGTYELNRAITKEGRIFGVCVVENRTAGAATYTATANTTGYTGDLTVKKSDGTGATFSGSVSGGTLTAQAVATEAPLAVGDKVVVGVEEYDVTPSPAAVTAVSGENITLESLTFVKKELAEIPEGSYTYKELLLPNFERTGFTNGTAKPGKEASLKLKLSGYANITINAKVDNNTKKANIKVGDTVRAMEANFTDYVFENIPAGDLTILFGQSDDTGNVQIDGTSPFITIEYLPDPVETSITAVEETANVTAGEEATLSFKPEGYADADPKTAFGIASGNTDVLTVDNDSVTSAGGLVTVKVKGKAKGTANVTITDSTDSSKTASVAVTVAAPKLTPVVNVDPTEVTVDADSNEKKPVTASATGFAEGDGVGEVTYAWDTKSNIISLSAKTGASVQVGATKGGSGKVTVTATQQAYGETYTATAEVNVTANSTKATVYVAPSEITLYEGQKLDVSFTSANFDDTAKSVHWGSASTDYVAVEDGTLVNDEQTSGVSVVTGVKATTSPVNVTVTVSNAGDTQTDSASIAVTVKALPTVTLSVVPETVALVVGGEAKDVTATVDISDDAATLSNVTWKVADEYAGKVSIALSDDNKKATLTGLEAVEGDIDLVVSATAVATSDAGEIGVNSETKTVKVTVADAPQTTISVAAPTDAVAAKVYEAEGDAVELTAPEVTATPADSTLEYVYTWTIAEADAQNIAFVGDNATTATGQTVKVKGLKVAEGAKVTLTVTVKDSTIAAEPVEFTVNVTEKEVVIPEPTGEYDIATSLTAGEDGKYTVEDDEEFTVTILAKKGFSVNSLTASLTYDKDVITLVKAESQTEILRDIVAAITDDSTTAANFIYEGTALKDETITDGAEVIKYTFKRNKGGSTKIAFKNIQTADSNFYDVVPKDQEVSIELTVAEKAVSTGKLHVLGDVNNDGLVNMSDAAMLLTYSKAGANPFEGYVNVADVMQSLADGETAETYKPVANTPDAAALMTYAKNAKNPDQRAITNDIVMVESTDANGVVVSKPYVLITDEEAADIIAKYPEAATNGAIIDVPAAKE